MASKTKKLLPDSDKNKIKNIQIISPWAKKTVQNGVMTNVGGFAGLFNIPDNFNQPVLVSASESAGLKLQSAIEFGYAETAGSDLAAMCFNHIAALGAKPLFFIDNIAFNQWDEQILEQIISGISFSCSKARCALLGGDTSVIPEIITKAGSYHVNGFCVGAVEKDKIINPANIKEKDIIIGLPSSGIHSAGIKQMMHILKNVLSLKASSKFTYQNKNMLELMMQPARIYTDIVEKLNNTIRINGAVHITEGGITENIPRIMPEHLSVYIEKYNILPEIFKILIDEGTVTVSEMFEHFNMGIGMMLFISPDNLEQAENCFDENNEPFIKMGEVRKSEKMIIEYMQ